MMQREVLCPTCGRRSWVNDGQDGICSCGKPAIPTGRRSDPELAKIGHKDATRPGRGKGPRLSRSVSEADKPHQEPKSDSPWLTPAEASDSIKMHVSYILKRIREGEIPAYHFGRSWRILKTDFDAWVASKARQDAN